MPSYYKDHTGFLVSAAIDKYVYITLHEGFTDEIIVKYSKLERVSAVSEIQHPIVREALQLVEPDRHHIEITSMADIPAGTGMGSSGSFTTALLLALHAAKRNTVSRLQLAQQACFIELDRLGEPIGKQDQFIAAFGGITCFTFEPDGSVNVEPLRMSPEAQHNLEDHLMLFFTGYTRSASDILRDQDQRSKSKDSSMIDNLHFVKKLGYESKAALEAGDLRAFAELMHVHWEHKKARSGGMSNSRIDELYGLARANGALGGKVIGAGGGGFLMVYAEDKIRVRRAMAEAGLREVRFRFDFEGAKVITNG